MEDYKEKIKELFLRYYRNIGEEQEKTYLSTKRILEMVGGVIPSKPISEHDIYECMTDMGFYQELDKYVSLKEIKKKAFLLNMTESK